MKFIKISTPRSFVYLNAAICKSCLCHWLQPRRHSLSLNHGHSGFRAANLGQVVVCFSKVCVSALSCRPARP